MSSSDGDFLEPVVKRKRKTPRRTRRRSEVLKTTSTAKKGDGRTVQSINQRNSPDLTTTTRPNQWSNISLNEGNSGTLLPQADINAGSQDNPLKIDSSSEDEFKTTKAIVNTKKGRNKTATLKGSKPMGVSKHSSGNTTYNKLKAIEKTTTLKTAPRLSIWNLSDPSSSEVEGPARPTNEHDDTTGPGLTGKSDKQPRSPNKDVLWTIIESRVPSLHGDEMDQRDFQDDEHNENFNEGLTTNVHDESPVNSKMISNLVTEANIIYKDPGTQGASKDREKGLLPFKDKLKAIKTKPTNTSSLSQKENCSEKKTPATMNVSKIKGIDIENASQSHVKDIEVENGIVKYKNLSLKTLTIPLTSVIMGDTESLYCNPTNIEMQEANDTMTSVGDQNSAMEELDHHAMVIPESSEPEDSDVPGESVKVLEQKRRLSLQSVDLFDSDPPPIKPSIKSIGGKKRNSTSSEHTCDSDATIKSADLMKLKMTNDETKKDISEQYSDLLQDIDFDMELSQSQSIISSQNPKPKHVTKKDLKVKPVISSSFSKISVKPVNTNEGQSPKYVIPGVKWKATTMTKRDFSSSTSDSPDDDGTTASILKDIRDRKDKLDHVKDDHNIDSNTGHQIHHAINKTSRESKTSKANSFRKHKGESGTEDQAVYHISCGLDLSEESVKNTEKSDSDVSPSKEMMEDSEDDIPLHELSKLKQNKKVKKHQVSGKNDDSDLDSDMWLSKVSPPKAQSSPRRKLKKKQKIASVKPLRSQEKKVQASKPLFSSYSDEESFDININPRHAQTTRNKKRPDYFFDTSTTDVSFNDDNRKNESTFKKDKDYSKHKSSKKALSKTFEETIVTEEKVESEKEDNVCKEKAAKPKFLLFPILNSTKANPSKQATSKKEVFRTEKINRSVDNDIKGTSDEGEVNLICLDSDDNENETMQADNETSHMEIKSDTEKKSNTKNLHMEKKPSNKTSRMERISDNENMEIKSRNEKKSDTEKLHMEKKPSNKTSGMERISDNENMEIKSRNEKKSDTEKLHMEKRLGNKISHMEKKSDNEDVYDSKNPQTETSSVKTDSKKLLISKKSKLKLGEIIKFVTLTPEKDKIISKEKGDKKSDVIENESTSKQEVEDKQPMNIDNKDHHEQDDLADYVQENPNTVDEKINIHDDLSLSDEDDIGDDGNIFDMSMEKINEDRNEKGIDENDSDNTLNLTQRMKDFENNACGSNNLTDDNVTDIQDIFRSFFTVENSSPEKVRKVEAVQGASEVPPNNNGKTMKTISTGTMKNLTSDEQNHTDRKLKSKNKIKQKTRKENEKNDNNKKHPKSVKKRKRDQKKHKSETQESGQKDLTSNDLKEKMSEKSTPPEEKNIDNVASRSCSPTMFSDGDDDSVHNNLTQIIQGLNSQENSPGRTMVKSQVDKSLSKVVSVVNCQQEMTDKMSVVLETPEKSGCDSKKLEISSRESSINNVSIEIENHLITPDVTRLEPEDSHERKSLETSAMEKSTDDTSFDTIEDPISVARLRHVSASTPIKKSNLALNDPDITVIENLPSHNISAIEQETTIDNVEDNLCNTKPVEPKVNKNKERDENGEESILLNDTNIVKKECVDDWIGYSQVEAPIVLSDSDDDETSDILTNLSQKPSMFIIEDEEDESDDNDDIFEELHVTAPQKSPEYVYIDSSDDDVHTVDQVIEKGKCENEQEDACGIKTEDELKDPHQNDLNTQSLLEDLDDVLLSLTQQVRQSTDEEDVSEADAGNDTIDIGEMSKGNDPCFQTEKSTEKFTEKKMNKPCDNQINIGGDLKDTSLDNNMKKDLNMSSDDDLALIASLNDYEDHMIDDDKVQIVEKSSETQRDKSRDKNINQNHVLSLNDSLPDISAKSYIKDSTTSTKRKEKSGGSFDSDEETFRTLLKKPKISHPVKEPILKNLPSKNRFGSASSAKQFQIPKSRHKSEGTKKAVAISPQRLKSKQEIRLSTKFYNKDSNKQSSFNKDTNESWLGKHSESRPSESLQKSLSHKKHTSIRGKTSLSKHRRSNTLNSTSLTQPIHDAKQAMRERARKVELEKKVPKVIRANPVKTSATSVNRFKSRNLGLVDSMTSPSTVNNRVKKPVSKPPSKPPTTKNRDGRGREKNQHVVKAQPVNTPSTSASHTKGSNAVPKPADPSHPQGLKALPPGNFPPAKTPFDTRHTTKELQSKRPQNSINPSRNLHRTHLVGATSRMQKEIRPYTPAVPTGQPAAARTPAAPNVQPQENFDMFLSHVIGWNVDWLAQQDRCKDPPPVVDEKKIWPLLDVYESYSDYCDLMTSLLLLETWQSIWKDWKEGQSSNGVQNLGITTVFPYTKHIFNFELHSVISEQNNRNQSNIREGDLVVLNYKVGRCNEKVEEKRCFGYVLRAQKFDRRKHKPHHALLEAGKQRGSVLMGYVIQTKKISPRDHETQLVRAEVVSNVINVMRQVRALNSLSQHVLCPHILKPTHLPIFGERVLTTNKALEEKFNPSQVKAIQWCSHAVLQPNNIPRLCLLQGPPGTGKSHTIVGLIKHILGTKCPSGNQPIRILICAPSNGAIDELMRRIIDEIRITKNSKSDVIKLKPVRVGNVNSVHPAIQQYTLDAVTQKHIKSCHASSVPGSVYEGISTLKVKIANLGKCEENYRKAKNTKQANKVQLERNNLLKEKAALDKKVEQILLEQMRRLTPQEENRKREEVLQGANIVASTLNFSGSDSILTTLRGSRLGRKNLDHFTAVIVDEASQTTELDCLVPLMHGCSKLILVGDPEQLPATVVSKKASDHKFGKSLFERLYRHFNDLQLARDNPVLMLDTQYRMHRDINRFPSQHVYNGRLHTDRKIAAKRDAFPFQPYLVFDVTEGQEEQLSGGSTRNKVEGSFVVELCRYILQCKAGKDLKGCHMGVITPYRGQKSFIQDQLNRRRGCEDIEVNTVDAFQGREKEIVIMSCVRAKSNTGTIGFLANRQRMNVALTRAKYALYVVGSLESVAVSEDWKALINDAKQRLKVVEVNTHWDSVFKKCVK